VPASLSVLGGTGDCKESLTKEEQDQNLLETPIERQDSEEADTESTQNVTEKNDSSSESDDDGPKFPDTHIKIQHSDGSKINITAEPVIKMDNEDNKEKVVFLGDGIPIALHPNQNLKGKDKKNRPPQQRKDSLKVLEQKDENIKQGQAKRGQKSKLKKIKEKYKDQDEEERKLRMEILQSSGSGKDTKKSKKNKEIQNSKNKKGPPRIPKAPPQKTENQEDADEDEPGAQAEVDMIDALTGQPLSEDELLFAVPVIAPYNTLSNYKFKVKLTPGTGRRGKAARTAVTMFLKDRTTTQREKDLLRAIKDEQLARNLPGKVKLSAPRLQVLRK